MIRKSISTVLLFIATVAAIAQNTETPATFYNSAERLLSSDSKLSIGGYAQIDYNQPVNDGTYNNGKLDVHRLILLFAYQFTPKTRFVTELEMEHVKEVFVEQAFINHEILPWLNMRGGLMLVPMGIVNEYHEPPTFNGVERPNLDSKIVPTTWREIGFGFAGRLDNAAVKYQLYVMNGFNGYNDGGTFRGTDGYRKGRQKGAESFMSSPTLSAKIDYYGIPGLKLGLATYNGKSQSSLYDGMDKNDAAGVAKADSSVIGISMLGLDARYNNGGFEAKAQFNLAKNSNTSEYNDLTGKDLGSTMLGWYVETAYDLFYNADNGQRLVPFARYEKYNTHAKTSGGLAQNKAYDRTDITFGAGWWLAPDAVLKADYQVFDNALNESKGQFNLGIGIWF
ncbi:MAG TPA: hypothetical protein VEP89_01750 [Draconibacterium sp.]|nr:hypothetical protein [Draconibacterium sp.]